MSSSATKQERKRVLQARTRSAKRLLIIASMCMGLGVLAAVAMAVLDLATQTRAVAMLSGPIALLALIAFAVLVRREAVAPRKMSFLGRAGICGVAVCAATMGTAQVLCWTGVDGGASLAALLTLVPALLAFCCFGSWLTREAKTEGVSIASGLSTIFMTHT